MKKVREKETNNEKINMEDIRHGLTTIVQKFLWPTLILSVKLTVNPKLKIPLKKIAKNSNQNYFNKN